MTPLVDVHCHLLAGLDDGPRTVDEAVQMCRIAWDEGTRVIAATSHLGEQFPDATPARIRAGTERLKAELVRIGVGLTVYPCAEVMIRPAMELAWEQEELLGVSDRNVYLLVEFPPGLFFDIRDMVEQFDDLGVRLILAHPERHPELLHEAGVVEELIHLGCLVQVSSESITGPLPRDDAQALKRWVQRGIVHVIGSDGHSPYDRLPRMANAHRRIMAWAGEDAANRLCSINGLIVLEGLPLRVPEPKPPKRRWFSAR